MYEDGQKFLNIGEDNDSHDATLLHNIIKLT